MKLSDKNKKRIIYGASSLGLALAGVVLYAPALLALSVTSSSILETASAIMGGVVLAGGFAAATGQYLKSDMKIKTLTTEIDVTNLTNKLKKHADDHYMGRLAAQAIAQIDRLNTSIKRVEFELERKFEATSMTYSKYYSAVTTAGKCAFENLNSFSNRIQLYSDEEYLALKHYREDDIPDDIQEKQIDLMKKNYELGRDSLAANEKLILGLDSLAMELASANFTADSETNTEWLNEITELTNQIKKYYI